jgi:hypothetical protein
MQAFSAQDISISGSVSATRKQTNLGKPAGKFRGENYRACF